jgi:hypothetical protein
MRKPIENGLVTGKDMWHGVEHRPHQPGKTLPQQGTVL